MFERLKASKGFTLIEVVIVIAIGALIILVILQAVSSAQRSQRDSTRRQEAGQIAAALEQYAANNGGVYPTNAAQVTSQVIGTAGSSYVSDSIRTRPWDVQDGNASTDCSGTGSVDYDVYYESVAPHRDYALFLCLEQGGANVEVRAGQ